MSYLGVFVHCHPPRRSILSIPVRQRKEVTFKDPSGIASTGLRLQLTVMFNVSAGAMLVVQPRLSHPAFHFRRPGPLQGHLGQFRGTSVLLRVPSSDIKTIIHGESTSLSAIPIHLPIDNWLVNRHATIIYNSIDDIETSEILGFSTIFWRHLE